MAGSAPLRDVRVSTSPHFPMTRREAALTAIVCANTRRTPGSVKPLPVRARDPPVAYPLSQDDRPGR